MADVAAVIQDQEVILYLTHKGRVRIAELRDALTTGRYRDPTGLLWSKRHFQRDLTVAVMSATPSSPLSLVLLDMNGLKQINDTYGHDAGDQVIKAYLQVVATFTGDGIDGYRGDGGDEVYLVLRATGAAAARKTIDALLAKLGAEQVRIGGEFETAVRACCGLITATDPRASPEALSRNADERLYRAKAISKQTSSRESIVVDSDT